jgi:endonuclease/exonuclease/phosphatase family metal-dependent hydrolase
MSFNLRGALSWDGRDSWPFRRGRVAEVIAAQAPTVAAFQEVLWPVPRFLGERLKGYSVAAGVPNGNRVLGARNMVHVASTATVGMVESGGFWLSPTPDRRSRGWCGIHVRSATWARVRYGGGGREVLVVNAHLDHGPEAARVGGVEVVLERLRRMGWPGVPAVVCGDFNCNPGDLPHRMMVEAGLRDSFVEAGGVDGPETVTFHGFRGRPAPGVGGDRRIDWIMCSPELRVRSAGIVTAGGPRWASDHYPVVAELEWA